MVSASLQNANEVMIASQNVNEELENKDLALTHALEEVRTLRAKLNKMKTQNTQLLTLQRT